MTFLLAEMTRDEIKRIAPKTVAVLSTASIEQHGPHLPVFTDSLLCQTVTHRAVEKASDQMPVVVAPILYYGSSHHHFPFAGVLSFTSQTFMTAVTEILEGLVRSGFRKLAVINGHGGNSDPNGVVGLDFVNRLNHPISIATANYWDIARDPLNASGLIPKGMFPGHAGFFETALVMAIRSDLVSQDGLAQVRDMSQEDQGLFADLSGAIAQRHGAWAASTGYTDNPALATAEVGQAMLDIIVQAVAHFLIAYHSTPES